MKSKASLPRYKAIAYAPDGRIVAIGYGASVQTAEDNARTEARGAIGQSAADCVIVWSYSRPQI